MLGCVNDINSWMSHKFLRLNRGKAEVAYLDSLFIKTKNQERNLGVTFDSNLGFKTHF